MARVVRDDIDRLHDYGIHPGTRTVYLESGTDDKGDELGVSFDMAQRVVKNLRLLDHASGDPITLVINTQGGDCFHGMGIYDAIRMCRSRVVGLVVGNAMSMGAVLLQACDERRATRHSSIMYHSGTLDGAPDMPAREGVRAVQYEEKHGDRIDRLMHARVLTKKPNLSWSKFKVECDRGIYLSAEEALEWGLLDAIEEEAVHG
jgi:ATP-dependent Clp protease protease subunit